MKYKLIISLSGASISIIVIFYYFNRINKHLEKLILKQNLKDFQKTNEFTFQHICYKNAFNIPNATHHGLYFGKDNVIHLTGNSDLVLYNLILGI